jgi:hypothetical protein
MPSNITREQLIQTVIQGQQSLHLNQAGLADVMGSSLRTVQRWYAERSTPTPDEVVRLVREVHPVDGALAGRLAAGIGQTLESLGVVAPPPPPTSPSIPSPTASARLFADAVVAAAAEALDVSPRLARPAVLAALRRAKIAGLSVEELLAVLGAPATSAARKAAGPDR